MSPQPSQPMQPCRPPASPVGGHDELISALDEQARLAQTLRELVRETLETSTASGDSASASDATPADASDTAAPTTSDPDKPADPSAREALAGEACAWLDELRALPMSEGAQPIAELADVSSRALRKALETVGAHDDATMALLDELAATVESMIGEFRTAGGARAPERLLAELRDIAGPQQDQPTPDATTASAGEVITDAAESVADAPASPPQTLQPQQPPEPPVAETQHLALPNAEPEPDGVIEPIASPEPLNTEPSANIEALPEATLSDAQPPETVDAVLPTSDPDPAAALSELSAQLAALADRIDLTEPPAPATSAEPATPVGFDTLASPTSDPAAEAELQLPSEATPTDETPSEPEAVQPAAEQSFDSPSPGESDPASEAPIAAAQPAVAATDFDLSIDPQFTMPHPPEPPVALVVAPPAIDFNAINTDTAETSAFSEPEPEPIAEVPADATEALADANTENPVSFEVPAEPSVEPAADFPVEIATDPVASLPEATPDQPVEPVEPAAPFVPPVADAPAVDAVSADAPLPSGELTAEQMAALMSGGLDPTPGDAMAIPAAQWGAFPLSLEASRVEQLQFMVAAAKVHLENLNVGLAQAAEFSTRADGCQTLRELANAVDVIAEAFNFDCLGTLSRLYREALNALPTVNDEVLPELLVRVVAIAGLFEQYLLGLEVGMEMRWQTELISRRVGRLCSGRTLAENITGWHKGEVTRLLELDGVNEPISPVPVEGGPSVEIAPGWFCHPVLAKWFDPEAAAAAAAAAAANTAAQKQAEGNTSLVRVPAVVLDKLLDTVSQLVLSKNRVVSLSRALHTEEGRQHRMEELATTADDLTQLCSDLQLIMMQARMQPVGKLFERYPRVIRDVASVADKTVELKLEGGATLVDKHVFEGLGEPLANLLRAVVQGSIEKSDARTALGKPATAVLVLRAENQGSQVFITLSHDGTPPDRVTILQKAVEIGMLTEAEMDSIAENDIPSLLFRDGSGDAALAKVGAQVRSIGGTIGFRPEKDGITQLLITVPLSVAIIPAVMVQVSSEIYAVPLQSVAEIVRLADHPVQTIRSHWVMRLRERVVPMVDIARTIGLAPSLCAAGTPGTETAAASQTSKPQTLVGDRFAIVVNAGDHHAALVVDRVVGKQDVVIKQLEGHTGDAGKGTGDAGFFSGATIRDDGRVSLIFETQRLIAAAQNDAGEELASISKGELESTPATTDVTSAA